MILSINATLTAIDNRGVEYESMTCELVIVDDGLVVLEATGLLKTNRERWGAWGFNGIHGAREESKGISIGS
ncbi:MAG: hypothetical protein ACTSWA_13785, partial [Candidatus Thorarchaeota archaeon]